MAAVVSSTPKADVDVDPIRPQISEVHGGQVALAERALLDLPLLGQLLLLGGRASSSGTVFARERSVVLILCHVGSVDGTMAWPRR
ncbi:hypothetical protein [Amycolatopsis speibonae]|uniref:Uncharacterized protein n=1 Tax=Amycolatopsis speibonae TaxID=1450224 RepID=A0ABV7PE73_9PSEU